MAHLLGDAHSLLQFSPNSSWVANILHLDSWSRLFNASANCVEGRFLCLLHGKGILRRVFPGDMSLVLSEKITYGLAEQHASRPHLTEQHWVGCLRHF